MADQFAANGYYCLMPDVFNGDPVPLNRPVGFDMKSWLTKGSSGNNPHTYQHVDPIVEAAIKDLKNKGYKKIGAVGYCFGAKYVARFMAKGKGLDVGYFAHPSFVEEEELNAIEGPLSIAAAETDHIFPIEKRHKSEVILKETKQPYQINLFSGVEHGFAVRCDTSVKIQRFAKEQAFLQAVSWFNEYLIAA
ncbi:hypothetical protein MMC08_008563 [Hypocenomyce scalaris]|nr:hypothetical protein [Hypocenomyce scalaris]